MRHPSILLITYLSYSWTIYSLYLIAEHGGSCLGNVLRGLGA